MDDMDKQVYNYLKHWLQNRGEFPHQITNILDNTTIEQLYIATGYIKGGRNDKEQVLKILTFKLGDHDKEDKLIKNLS